ncbi:MAG: ATP-dependent RecD-like DNA helicase [Mycoplasmatota bacterium]
MNIEIKAKYRRTIFETEKGYLIGIFKVIETDSEELIDYIDKSITVTGYFDKINKDDTYLITGEILDHPKFGFQFNANNYQKIKPSDKDGIVEFLSSDLFPTIGDKLAQKIVNKFGTDTLEIILNNKESLLQIPKISYKKINIIYDNLVKYEESHKTIVYLSELGFSMKNSLKIYNKFHERTIPLIEQNIYSILDEIEDIRFFEIDEIYLCKNEDYLSENRIKAAIIYLLNDLAFKNGDTYFTLEQIVDTTNKFLKYQSHDEFIITYIEELIIEEKIIFENEKYYLKKYYEQEINIANKLNLLNKVVDKKIKNIDSTLETMEKINAIVYDDLQKEAILTALTNNLTIITGGPGTGKTTIIKAIVEAYQLTNKYNYEQLVANIALLAPTGRASKRMSESTSLPATTIHRFLKWNKESDTFSVNKYNKDHSHLIIIDEASMIDISLFNSLLEGLTDNIKLVIVGDYNQLPSVGPGQVLKDLIESESITTIKLNNLYRQSKESYIPILAKNINENTDFEIEYKTNDFNFLECNNIVNNIISLISQIEKKYDMKKVQLMAPMYSGINGIDNLNKILQSILNKPSIEKKEIKIADIIYRENDKILLLVNLPDNNVYNGDIGILESIIDKDKSESKKMEFHINFDGNIVIFNQSDLIKIKHGYIISIHKAQGSEFEFVILPVSSTYNRMLYKKLIYTAITRAKKKLIILGQVSALKQAINNNLTLDRKTTLNEKIMNK